MSNTNYKKADLSIYGKLSWANFFDWLVTLCLGIIFILTAFSLGGVRPESHLRVLPFYVLLIFLHSCWFVLSQGASKILNEVPLWFIPGLLWLFCSIILVSPVQCRGWYEMIYAIELLVIFWVLVNNLKTVAHIWSLIVISLFPVLIGILHGFYQFFQKPDSIFNTMKSLPLDMNYNFLGRATGFFLDPNAYAAFLLILLPFFLIIAVVALLPVIIRILALYIASMLVISIVFTQSYWAVFSLCVVLVMVPWFCFESKKRRFVYSLTALLTSCIIFILMLDFHPLFQKGLQRALSYEGEGVRFVLWREALAMASENPITGQGAGAFSASIEQSTRVVMDSVPETPHNDYLLVLSQLGFVGLILFLTPILYILYKSYFHLIKEPYKIILEGIKGAIIPERRLLLSIGITGTLTYGLCLALNSFLYVPALSLYGTLFLALLVRISFNCRLKPPDSWVTSFAYSSLAMCAALSFYVINSSKLEAHALELRAKEELEHVIDMQIHITGDNALLDDIIEDYEDAVIMDDSNTDAWLGLSASICQTYYRNPELFKVFGKKAIMSAKRAVELSPNFWKTWAQLGIVRAFYGEGDLAEAALEKALELAPNNSNANYYYAAYISIQEERRNEALDLAKRALEINPSNHAASRLLQKLRIL